MADRKCTHMDDLRAAIDPFLKSLEAGLPLKPEDPEYCLQEPKDATMHVTSAALNAVLDRMVEELEGHAPSLIYHVLRKVSKRLNLGPMEVIASVPPPPGKQMLPNEAISEDELLKMDAADLGKA